MTERIMALDVGKSVVVSTRHLLETARLRMPDRVWTSEARDGGYVVRRVK